MSTTFNANISSPTPPAGSGEWAKFEVQSGDTYIHITRSRVNALTSYIYQWLRVSASNLADTETFKTLQLLDSNDDVCSEVVVINDGGTHKVYARFYDEDESGDWIISELSTISVGAYDYEIEYQYDTFNGTWEFRVDGSSIDSGSLSDNTRLPCKVRTGIVDAPSDKTITIYVDDIKWDTSGWVRGASGLRAETINFSETIDESLSTSRGRSESISFSETIEDWKATGVVLSDNLSCSDARVSRVTTSQEVSDTLSLAGVSGPIVFSTKGVSESIAFSISSSNIRRISIILSDTITFSETIGNWKIAEAILSDNLLFADVNDFEAFFTKNASESILFSDAQVPRRGTSGEILDTLSLAEVISNIRRISIILSDTITFSETLPVPQVFILGNTSDGITFTDSCVRFGITFAVAATETINLGDVSSNILSTVQSSSEQLTFQEVLSKYRHTSESRTDSIAFVSTEHLLIQCIRETSDSVTFEDVESHYRISYPYRADGVLFSEQSAFQAAVSALREDGIRFIFEWPTYYFTTSALQEEIIHFSVSSTRVSIRRGLIESGIDLTEQATRTNIVLQTLMQDGITISDEVARVAIALAAIQDGIEFTDKTWLPLFTAYMTEIMSFSDTLAVRKMAQALRSDSFSFSDVIRGLLVGLEAIVSDQIEFTDAVDGLKNLILALRSDEIQFSESTGLFSLVLRANVADNIVLGEAISNIASLVASLQDTVEFADRCLEVFMLPSGKVSVAVNLKQASLTVEFKPVGVSVDVKEVGIVTTFK
jgi:hypothetical protein